MKTTNRRNGFTLVELLVVIVIIVTLATLVFLGFQRMKMAADKVTTTRNLSQIQIANTEYATDHNGGYVPVRAFDDKGASYVAWFQNPDFLDDIKGYSAKLLASGKVDTSVSQAMLDPIALKADKSNSLLAGSYGYNSEGQPNTGGWGSPNSTSYFRMEQLTSPARSAAFFTATDWQAKYSGRFLWKGAAAVEGRTGDGKIAYRYGEKAIVAYYDGHVEEVGMADMKRIDQQGGVGNIFWNADAK